MTALSAQDQLGGEESFSKKVMRKRQGQSEACVLVIFNTILTLESYIRQRYIQT